MKKWFALHTKPRAERRVVAQLERRDIDTFLPQKESASGASSARSVPFFPGYVFIRVDLTTESSAVWRWTPGVRYMVAYGNEPIPIADEVIALIKHKTKAHPEADRSQSKFKPGDLVRIKEGPFRDMLAIFEESIEPRRRVHVLLQAMDRSVRLRMSPTNLDEVKADRKRRREKPPRRTQGRGRPIRS